MEIVYGNYRCIPNTNAPGSFDLIEKVTRTRKDSDDEYEGENPFGYGMRLDTCIKRIIDLELTKKKSVVSLREYLDEWRIMSLKVISTIEEQQTIQTNGQK